MVHYPLQHVRPTAAGIICMLGPDPGRVKASGGQTQEWPGINITCAPADPQVIRTIYLTWNQHTVTCVYIGIMITWHITLWENHQNGPETQVFKTQSVWVISYNMFNIPILYYYQISRKSYTANRRP